MADSLRDAKDGEPYRRRPEVEAQIDALLQLPPEEVARRAKEEGRSSQDFVATETVLYFIRQKRFDHWPLAMKSLYETLRHRIKSLHRAARRTAGPLTLEEVEEVLLHRVEELLALDRLGYEKRLDWFECMFNSGLFTLRLNSIRDVKITLLEKPEPLHGEDHDEVSPEVEAALARFSGSSPDDDREREYRMRLFEVISGLPEELKRVIEMHDLRGMPMDSPKLGVPSVSSVLGIGEQTVRKRRKKALQMLKNALQGEV